MPGCRAAAKTPRSGRNTLAEFTGERVIPGEVDIDLLNEHLARYTFAARLARGKRVLDAGCGAGYGSAELARAAERVVGVDRAAEAIEFARTHYQSHNLSFEEASCTGLPHGDGSFDLVVAFEVIEHLENWREFLAEARRVLAPGGQLIVSTPNRLYYTESRGPEGANPFHVHEFTFEEFREALEAVFPSVALFLENHVEGVTFQPHQAGNTVEARVDAGEPAPDESHFFVAVCANRPQIGNPTFVYVPRTANVLRERERHIALLESEVATKDGWLAERQREHEELLERHREQTAELERSNEWAEAQSRELAERRARVGELQEELAREQEQARRVVEGYQAKIKEIEEDLRAKTQWAQETEARLTADLGARLAHAVEDLARAVDALHSTERDLNERTAWALRLQEEGRKLEDQLMLYRASRWVKLGRKIGLGPELPAN
jgi:SAM-dependent methyltransferase